jgi:hypothetical protein
MPAIASKNHVTPGHIHINHRLPSKRFFDPLSKLLYARHHGCDLSAITKGRTNG